MIYTIEHYLFIQSNKMLDHVLVELKGEKGDYSQSFQIEKSCYIKIHINAPPGKFKVKLTSEKYHLEKQIKILS